MASLYNIEIEKLKGIGAKRGELFRKLGVNSIGQLLNFYPRAYENWTDVESICDLTDGQVCCIKATVCSHFNNANVQGKNKFISKVSVCDESGLIELVFFNNKYIDKMLKGNETYYFYGKVKRTFSSFQMISPAFSKEKTGASLHPIYKLTTGLTNYIVSNAVKTALDMLPETINDPMPQKILREFDLVDLKTALFDIHFPKDNESLENARKRLVTEELLVLNLGLKNLKNHSRGQNKNIIVNDFSEEYEKLLPYKLTNAQKNSIKDCLSDVKNSDKIMNRLIQGDVGSGKTAIAGSLCYTFIKNGMQTAFMAPTEMLAEQHFKNFSKLFANSNIKVGLLIGSMTASNKNKVRQEIEAGEIDLIIGTHSLITDKTNFKNLALVITDEQHRFGVKQRSKLLDKGNNPHLLVMSATPIPRTLGLIIYGDLDISIVNELPPNRMVIDTLLIDTEKRDRAYNFILKHIEEGKQAYIVCPLVEEGDLDIASVEEYGAELMLKYFRDVPIGIVHGKLKASQKEEIMRGFNENKIKILVATTVIEVGIDVPNATIMMIENAERFGLSQLHQLRGRVGRGKNKSYCILVSDKNYGPSYERLKVMCNTLNGFDVADADFKMRGPGDFFGSRQHGLPEMKIAGFSDTENLELSQKICDYIIKNSDFLNDEEYKGLRREISQLFSYSGDNSFN